MILNTEAFISNQGIINPDIAEILLKVVLNTITLTHKSRGHVQFMY